jgi:hypothetical protein
VVFRAFWRTLRRGRATAGLLLHRMDCIHGLHPWLASMACIHGLHPWLASQVSWLATNRRPPTPHERGTGVHAGRVPVDSRADDPGRCSRGLNIDVRYQTCLPMREGNFAPNPPLPSNIDPHSRILFRPFISSRPQSRGSQPVRVVQSGLPMVLRHMSQGRPSDFARCRAYPHGRGLVVVLVVSSPSFRPIPMGTSASIFASQGSTTQTRRQR